MNAKQVLEFAKKNNAVMVDLRFTDWPGTWQHCSYPIDFIDEGTFEDGMGFDGSSIRGWQTINESDMLMIPDAETGFIDPFFKHPTLVLYCDIVDPDHARALLARPALHRDQGGELPQAVGHRRHRLLRPGSGVLHLQRRALQHGAGPRLLQRRLAGRRRGTRAPRSRAGTSPTSRARRRATFPTPPLDSLQDIRTEMCLTMQELGIKVEAQHHEVATAGQAEIDMVFARCATWPTASSSTSTW